MSYQYEELAGSARSQHDAASGNGGERFFLCLWNERYAFAQSLAGYQWPGLPYCYCRNITIEPFSPDLCPKYEILTNPNSQLVSYEQNGGMVALVRASYATDYGNAAWPCTITKPSHPEGTSLKLRVRTSGQFLTMPGDSVRWEDNCEAYPDGPMPGPDVNARIVIPITEYHVEWDYVDEPPLDEWDELIGCVNSDTFLDSEAETILFEGYEVDQSSQFSLLDPYCWKLSCVFRKRRIQDDTEIRGWNHEMRQDGWVRIRMKDTGGNCVDRYDQADFSSMFTEATCGGDSSSSPGA